LLLRHRAFPLHRHGLKLAAYVDADMSSFKPFSCPV
jgi:hypothetical protein